MIGVYTSSGNLITNSTHIGLVNPLRYRGYYYDSESGFYYLGSRYYDPQTFRFINADSTGLLTSTPMSVNNKNLFTYCNNNPVMLKDVNGYIAATAAILIGIGVVAVVSGLISGIVQVSNEGSFWQGFKGGFMNGLIGAGGVDLAIGAGLSTGGVALVGAASGAIGYVTQCELTNSEVTESGILISAAFGGLGGTTSSLYSAVSNTVGESLSNQIAQETVFDFITALGSNTVSVTVNSISGTLHREESRANY